MTLLFIVHLHTSTIMWLNIYKLQYIFLYILAGYTTSLIQSVIWWWLHDIILYFYGHNLVQNSSRLLFDTVVGFQWILGNQFAKQKDVHKGAV